MSAMTWWDHETKSVWSQPWGMAISGPLEGTRLSLIPAGIVPWAAWRAQHPETLVLNPRDNTRKRFSGDFVIGIALGEHAKAYPFQLTSEVGIVNDQIGDFPVVVIVDADTRAVHSFLRRADDLELEFMLKEGNLVDRQTESTWDVSRGIAVNGPLRGEVLPQVPYITSFDWAWKDFYPHSEFFDEADNP